MVYSIPLLTTKTLCDAVLAFIDEQLRVLTKKQTDAAYQQVGASMLSAEQQAELAFLLADITSSTTLIASLPPSDKRKDRENKLRKDTDRRDELLARQADSGPVAVLKNELAAGRVEVQINELTTQRAKIVTHRSPLPA